MRARWPLALGLAVGLAVAHALAGTLAPACAQESGARPDLEVHVEVGFEGTFVEGAWAPVAVTLELPAHAPAVSGRVVLEPVPLERAAWFAAPFALPSSPSGSRTRVLLGAPTWGDKSFAVRVEDALGRELSTVVPSAHGLERKDRLALATRPSGLAAFADTPARGAASQASPLLLLVRAAPGPRVELRERFPARSELMQALATVVLSDTSGVSELLRDSERAVALEGWVRAGGCLVVVGGGQPFWLGTPLEEWLPVSADGHRGSAPAWSLGFLGSPPGGLTVTEANLREGGVLLEGTLQHPLAAARSLGAGRVVFLAFDPDVPEVRGSSEAARFLRGLVGPARGEPFPIAPERLARLALAAWEDLTPLSIPGLGGVGLAALATATIAGVGAARRRARPDRIWVAPALSAGLAAVVVLVASLAREPGHARSIAWVFVDPGAASGSVVEDLALSAGGAASFELELAPGVLPLAQERPKFELVDFRARRAGLSFVPGAPLRLGPVDLVPKGLATALVARRGALVGAPLARVRLDGWELVLEAAGRDPLPAGFALAIERGTGKTVLFETPVVTPGSPARVPFDAARDLASRLREDEAAGPLWERPPERVASALLLRTLALLEPRPGSTSQAPGPLVCLALPGPSPALARARARARGSSDEDPATDVPMRASPALYLYAPSEGSE